MTSLIPSDKFKKINEEIGQNTSSYKLKQKLHHFTSRGRFSGLHEKKIIDSLVGSLSPLQLRILKNSDKGLTSLQIRKIIQSVNRGTPLSLSQKKQAHLLLKHLGHNSEENNNKLGKSDNQILNEQKRRNIRASMISSQLSQDSLYNRVLAARAGLNKNVRPSLRGGSGSIGDSPISKPANDSPVSINDTAAPINRSF